MLVASLAAPAVAIAGGNQSGQKGSDEQAASKGESDGQQAQEGSLSGASEQTQERAKTQARGEDSSCDEGDQPKTRERVRAELHEGAYPDEPLGDGDRTRDRERSSEESQSAETLEPVDPPATIDPAPDASDVSVESGGEASEMGFVARVRRWFQGALETLGLS
jgi:hypothetical protein